MRLDWIGGFEITVKSGDREVVLAANREGLLSLAAHLTALAESPAGRHIHLDEFNSLEEGSAELIVQKI